LALTGCMMRSNDVTLESTVFDEATCPAGSDADRCFLLRAETGGTEQGQGRCEVVAVDDDGSGIAIGATFGPLLLAPGRSFEWLVELQEVDDPAFDGWTPECHLLEDG
jgi:hypothetical protein